MQHPLTSHSEHFASEKKATSRSSRSKSKTLAISSRTTRPCRTRTTNCASTSSTCNLACWRTSPTFHLLHLTSTFMLSRTRPELMAPTRLSSNFDEKWSSDTRWNSTTISSSVDLLQRLLLLVRIPSNMMVSANSKPLQLRSVRTQVAILMLELGRIRRKVDLVRLATMQNQHHRMMLLPLRLLPASNRVASMCFDEMMEIELDDRKVTTLCLANLRRLSFVEYRRRCLEVRMLIQLGRSVQLGAASHIPLQIPLADDICMPSACGLGCNNTFNVQTWHSLKISVRFLADVADEEQT